MDDFIITRIDKLANEKSKWIDQTILNSIPVWKASLLKKYPSKFLATILRVNIEIIYEELIGNFGRRIIIKNNGKIIDSRMFKF